MLNKCARYCVKKLEKYYPIEDDDKDVYIYGFEITFSTLFSLSSVTLLSLLLGHIEYALFFVLFFFSLRLFCGGYHADTYARCFIITNLTFLSTVAYTDLVMMAKASFVMPVLFFLGAVVIFLFSPVKNENHPCSQKTFKKNKFISRCLVCVYAAAYIPIFVFVPDRQVAVNAAWSLISVSIMIIIEKIKQKGVKRNESNQCKNC